MAENEVENIYDPAGCRNFDVCGTVDRLNRLLYELCTSESAHTNEFNADDQRRFLQMWNEVNVYVTSIQEQDRLDINHAYPAQYTFRYVTQESGIEWENVKNSFVRDLARLSVNAQILWSRSESADASNKFIPADLEKWTKVYDRGVAMVTKYADVVLPGDKPESSDYELNRRGVSTGPV